MKTAQHSFKNRLAGIQLFIKLFLGLIIAASPTFLLAQEMTQNTVSNGAGVVSGGNYTGYFSVGQMATYMYANGTQIATQGIILNEISGDIEFTFELSGNLTANNNTNAQGLVLKSSAAELIGDPLSNTKVYLILVETGEIYDSTVTNSQGYFEFLHVPYLNFYFVVEEPIIPQEPVFLNFVESTVFVKDVEINGEVGSQGITTEIIVTPQATTVPEEQTKSLYVDKDMDGYGFGSLKIRLNINASESGYSANNSDCDDDDPNVYPGATDIAGSGIDANCDGIYLWYFDNDGDGLGSLLVVESANDEPGVGEANNNFDTDDSSSALCDDIELFLDNRGETIISSADINIFDSENDVSFVTSPAVFNCDDIGDSKKVSIVVTSSTGDQKYCGASVTVIGDIPNVTISESELPEFCQGSVLLLTANSEAAIAYEWSNGTEEQISEISTNGIYNVTVTSATGCTTTEKYIVNGFNAGELVSSYTLLAQEEIHLHGSNIVESGAVGVTKVGKKVKLHQASHVYDFVQASKIETKDGSTVGNEIHSPAQVLIPAFIKNTKSRKNSKDIKAKKNRSVILDKKVYGKIEIEERATVLFTASHVYIEELVIKKKAVIEFESCSNLYIKKELKLEENSVFNSNGNKVVVYVNDDVEIKAGSSVTARIHANNNDIHVKGNRNKSTTMTGMFIGKKIHGDKHVIWNMDRFCPSCENQNALQFNNVPYKSGEIFTGVQSFGNEMKIKVYPNPTTGRVNLEIDNIITTGFTVGIFNMNGQKIFDKSYLPQNRIELDLTGNTPGIYFVKINDGETHITEKLLLKNK